MGTSARGLYASALLSRVCQDDPCSVQARWLPHRGARERARVEQLLRRGAARGRRGQQVRARRRRLPRHGLAQQARQRRLAHPGRAGRRQPAGAQQRRKRVGAGWGVPARVWDSARRHGLTACFACLGAVCRAPAPTVVDTVFTLTKPQSMREKQEAGLSTIGMAMASRE